MRGEVRGGVADSILLSMALLLRRAWHSNKEGRMALETVNAVKLLWAARRGMAWCNASGTEVGQRASQSPAVCTSLSLSPAARGKEAVLSNRG